MLSGRFNFLQTLPREEIYPWIVIHFPDKSQNIHSELIPCSSCFSFREDKISFSSLVMGKYLPLLLMPFSFLVVSLHDVFKNNYSIKSLNVCLHGSNVSPGIYPETLASLYRPGMTIADLSDAVISFTDCHMQGISDIRVLQDRNYILDSSYLVICNGEWNRQLLSTTPHRRLEGIDLAVYPRVMIGDDGSVRITNSHLESLGISGAEMLAAAAANSKKDFVVMPVNEMMGRMTGTAPETMPPINMAVVTNKSNYGRAAAMADPDMLEAARRLVGSESVYIIPSSVHEVLVLPAGSIPSEDLETMIRDINAEIVSLDERLGDHPYLYDGAQLQIADSHDQKKQLPAGKNR